VRVILVEFLWHAKKIVCDKESFEKDIIVSLDPESSYILKNNKIRYFESYQFCDHKKLWPRYKDITNQSIEITEKLDEALWSIDKRFKELNWKLFNDFHYAFKISFDQLFYYSELISNLIDKFNPSEIIVADTGEIVIDDNLLINEEISVIKYLLIRKKKDYNKIKISFVIIDQDKKSVSLFLNIYKKIKFSTVKNFITRQIKNIYYNTNLVVNYYTLKSKYLSINCAEVLKYKKLYPKESKYYLNYNVNNEVRKFKSNNIFFENFKNYLVNKTSFLNLINNKNMSFEIIFYEILSKFIQRLDFLIQEHNKAKKIIDRMKPACVIFQSMACFYLPNVIFRKNCVDSKIPFVTWAHGGLGLTYSVAPYDMTDFRFCKNHIAYGPFLKDLVEDNRCILNKLELSKNQKVFSVGSCKLDHENRNKVLKNDLKKNNKPTVIFFMGFNYKRNNIYFGRNREKKETLVWEFVYDILYLLQKYQNKYNIIFKDNYIQGRTSLWQTILKNINADKILYLTNEYTVNDLLRISDLNILPWTSTTFFESLYFDADIFLLEEDIFEKAFEEKLKNEIFFSDNTEKFKTSLEKYLEEGNFYQNNKDLSKKYFLNFDKLNNKDKLFNTALNNILES